MLSFLLENMHEDCNQVSKKPYVEQRDSNGRADKIVAKEFWDGFLQREKSIFVDLFYGQLKSRVQCTLCKHVSITFDPYNVLSVPLPKLKTREEEQSHIEVNYYPQSLKKAILKFKIPIDFRFGRGSDLLVQLTTALAEKIACDPEY